MSLVSTTVHALGVGLFGYSLYYDLVHVHASADLLAKNKNIRDANAWPGKWKYLTIWNLVLQLVYHVVALINDLVGSSELNRNRQTFLQKLRDAYYASLVFPTGMFVCTVFWGMYCVDEKLILLPIDFPPWLNHVMHTVPVISILTDSIMFPHSYQKTELTLGALLCGMVAYVAWIVWIHQITNVWPYPVLSILGTTGRASFISAAGVVMLMFYFLGEALNQWRWGAEIAANQKGKKKSK